MVGGVDREESALDVNEYMRRSVELQERAVALLERLAGGAGSTVTVVVDAADAAREIGEAAEQVRRTADAAAGSGRQAANHARDDAAQEAAAEEAKGEKPPKIDDVRAALATYGQRQGNPAAIALLKKYGATSVSGLSPDDYAALVADATAEG